MESYFVIYAGTQTRIYFVIVTELISPNYPECLRPDADSFSLRVSYRAVADAQQLSQPVDQYQCQSRADIHV